MSHTKQFAWLAIVKYRNKFHYSAFHVFFLVRLVARHSLTSKVIGRPALSLLFPFFSNLSHSTSVEYSFT
uniref:Uncharacterized protein n=1 Tax=Utricularia reniformis TaxID=192314 RepID=A0A1Y0AZ74_9LAMI|nr:hypothetical protein AEK19_MT2296 [Utricularia reniformis]ART30444.1 hypothetical protein AEK19_MT2296 [Utricularia reniformis]